MSGDKNNGDYAGALRPAELDGEGSDKPQTVSLLAEELAVTRERVETGRVRVKLVTREHDELVDVPLARDNVEIERIAIDRPIDTIPPTRQEGDTTIVPVVHEVLVLERRLILKEELHVRRVHVTEQHQERVVLRHQEAVIIRTPAETPDASPKGE